MAAQMADGWVGSWVVVLVDLWVDGSVAMSDGSLVDRWVGSSVDL